MASYSLVRLEPARNRVALDRWSPQHSGVRWNEPYLLEGRADLAPDRPLKLRLLVDVDAVVYVDERVALSGRIYERRGGALGLFATGGEVRFEGFRMASR